MNILSIENLEKNVNDGPLFKEVNLGIEHNEKIGLVGKNGEGKTTFLKTLMGLTPPDEGKLSTRKNLNIVYLQQNIEFGNTSTIEEFLYEDRCVKLDLLKEYNNALKNKDHKSIDNLYPILEANNCFDIEYNYKAFLTQLKVDKPLNTRLNTLSGGEIKKVSIARALSYMPELLILDEVTNHLDIRTIEYLENYLKAANFAILIVTHDRYILNSLTTTIWELDDTHFYRHSGSFEYYLERREERYKMLQKEQDKINNILRRELLWLQRGAKARTGKDKNRIERIEKMQSMQRQVLEREQSAFSQYERRLGKKILDLENISKSFNGKRLFFPFTYSFKKGDKIGIIGNNGSGKSTLLDIIAGVIKPDEGSVDLGMNTIIGYYDQKSKNLKEDKTIIEYINEIGENIYFSGSLISSSRFLEIFNFPQKTHRTPISLLSGGEKRRLYLISKLILNPNFLILDEPTNDLDIFSIENLEEYISAFTGVTIVVSHDRAFLDSCVDTLIVIDEDKNIFSFAGNYSDYLKKNENQKKEKDSPKTITENKKRIQKGLSYKERKELETLETELNVLYQQVKELEESFSVPTKNLEENVRLYNEKKALIDKKENRLLSLMEKDE